MAKRAPRVDQGDDDLRVGRPKDWSVGMTGAIHGVKVTADQAGVVRAARTLLRVNQPEGFDCPGCAWPEPSRDADGKERDAPFGGRIQFCENGAKAVGEEATLRRLTPEFFAEHPVSELRTKSDHWLGQQGRLTE
ncbi:MAG TPA: hypothetical protein VIP98_04260, partial [Microlunatus sp.]